MSPSSKSFEKSDNVDHSHMENVLEQLCKKTLDLTGRNSLIHFGHSARRKNYIRVIDERYNFLFTQLLSKKFLFNPLPGLEEALPDENTQSFNEAFNNALIQNEEYAKLIESDKDSEDHEFEINKLERAIKDNLRLELGLRPRPKSSSDQNDLKNLAEIFEFDPNYELKGDPDGDEAHSDNKIQTIFPEIELNKRLSNIYNSYKRELTDRSINPLYIIFGFLNWKDSNRRDKTHSSPLVLMPIQMERKSTKIGYQYSINIDNEPFVNEALREKLNTQYGIILPELGDHNEENFKLSNFLKEVGEKIQNKTDWILKPYVTIAPLKHSCISIYEDLKPENWPGQEITSHENLSKLLKGTSPNETGEISLKDYADIDQKIINNECPNLYLDCDSSQYNAIIKIMEGDPLIIQGPPGTGKSQTISNAIAALASKGKKILFIAEKAAAINQIAKNLKKVNFDSLVFEAHAEINKDKMYESLKERFDLNQSFNERFYKQKKAELVKNITHLNDYKDFLFKDSGFPDLLLSIKKESDTLNYYELIGRYLSLFHKCKSLNIPKVPILKNPIGFSIEEFRSFEELVGKLLEYGRLDNSEILDIKNLGVDEISISVFKEEISKLEALANDFKEFSNTSNYNGTLIKALNYLENEGIELENNIVTLKEELKDVAGKIFRARTKELILKYRNNYLADISINELEEVENALLNLGLGSITLNDSKKRIEEAQGLKVNIDYAISLKNSILNEIDKEQDREILNLVKKVSRIDSKSLCNYNKELSLSASFKVSDFGKFAALFDELDILIFKTTGSKSQKSLKEAKSKIANIEPSLLGNKSAGLSRLNILRSCKEIYLKRNLFSFLFDKYKGTVKLLNSFGVNHKDENQSIQLIDNLIKCLEKYESIFANSISELFDDESKIIKLSKKELGQFKQNVINPINNITEDLISDSSHNEILNFVAHNDSSLLVDSSLEDIFGSNDFERINNLVEKRIKELEIVDSFYSKTKFLKKDANFNLWSIDSRKSEYDKIFKDLLSKQDIEIEINPQNYGELFPLVSDESDLLSFSKLLSVVIEYEDDEAYLNELEKGLLEIQRKIEQNQEFFGILGIKNENQYQFFESAIYNDIKSYCFKLNTLISFCEKYYIHWKIDIELDENILEMILYFSSLSSSELSKIINQKDTEEKINKSAFKEILDSPFFNQSDSKDILVDFAHLQLISVFLFCNEYIRDNQILEKFSKNDFENSISSLKELTEDLHVLERNKSLSVASSIVIEKGIDRGPKKTFTDKALIENEVKKKRAKLAIRPLIKRASKALTQMKPIWLMTPQKVSDNLPREREMFDYVIIDEASQMVPEYAIPSIIRGKQLVVVGDKKQMPPTNFFNAALDIEEEEIESESILDACESTLGKTVRLNYHYRSKHQNLIQFSNKWFYDNELNIVNSAKIHSEDLGVKLIYAENALYSSEKSSGKNEMEADRVIEIIDECILNYPNRSIGVVTINRAQQDLLEQKWSYHCEDNKKAKDYVEYWEKEENKSETMIFRNLERIQGDERDIIIISTVYGKNENGNVMQRFGPILSKSGDRRLNVLFTRAKCMTFLVTSLQSGDIRDPQSSIGKNIFHKYLHYAKDPNNNLHTGQSLGEPDSDFEIFVADKIRSYGYEVDYQIGVNGFKIDLGIKDPKDSSIYIAGIECDGATFHSSPQARDRDILRQSLLEDYGWKIFRIWSTDWFRDSDGEMENLIKWLKEIRDPMPSTEPQVINIGSSTIKQFKKDDSITEIWSNNQYVCMIIKHERRTSYADDLMRTHNRASGFNAESKLLLHYIIEGKEELKGVEFSSYEDAFSAIKDHL